MLYFLFIKVARVHPPPLHNNWRNHFYANWRPKWGIWEGKVEKGTWKIVGGHRISAEHNQIHDTSTGKFKINEKELVGEINQKYHLKIFKWIRKKCPNRMERFPYYFRREYGREKTSLNLTTESSFVFSLQENQSAARKDLYFLPFQIWNTVFYLLLLI